MLYLDLRWCHPHFVIVLERYGFDGWTVRGIRKWQDGPIQKFCSLSLLMSQTLRLSAFSASLWITPRWSAVDALEEWHAEGPWQTRKVDEQLDNWTRSSERSCMWVETTPSIRTAWGMNGLWVALWRKTWRYWQRKNWTWGSKVHLQPRKRMVSEVAAKQCGQ